MSSSRILNTYIKGYLVRLTQLHATPALAMHRYVETRYLIQPNAFQFYYAPFPSDTTKHSIALLAPEGNFKKKDNMLKYISKDHISDTDHISSMVESRQLEGSPTDFDTIWNKIKEAVLRELQ